MTPSSYAFSTVRRVPIETTYASTYAFFCNYLFLQHNFERRLSDRFDLLRFVLRSCLKPYRRPSSPLYKNGDSPNGRCRFDIYTHLNVRVTPYNRLHRRSTSLPLRHRPRYHLVQVNRLPRARLPRLLALPIPAAHYHHLLLGFRLPRRTVRASFHRVLVPR